MKRTRWLLLIAYVAVLPVIAGCVFCGLRLIPSTTLTDFAAPDGSCVAKLPGRPSEQPVAPPGEPFTGGKRFVAGGGWGSKVSGEVGWFDLPAADVKLLRPEDLFQIIRDRRAEDLAAKVDAEAVIRIAAHNGREVRFTAGNARHIERHVLVTTGAQPRVYYVSVGGPGLDPDGEVAKKVIGSFRVLGAPPP